MKKDTNKLLVIEAILSKLSEELCNLTDFMGLPLPKSSQRKTIAKIKTYKRLLLKIRSGKIKIVESK
jgi:hypothetical protein